MNCVVQNAAGETLHLSTKFTSWPTKDADRTATWLRQVLRSVDADGVHTVGLVTDGAAVMTAAANKLCQSEPAWHRISHCVCGEHLANLMVEDMSNLKGTQWLKAETQQLQTVCSLFRKKRKLRAFFCTSDCQFRPNSLSMIC